MSPSPSLLHHPHPHSYVTLALTPTSPSPSLLCHPHPHSYITLTPMSPSPSLLCHPHPHSYVTLTLTPTSPSLLCHPHPHSYITLTQPCLLIFFMSFLQSHSSISWDAALTRLLPQPRHTEGVQTSNETLQMYVYQPLTACAAAITRDSDLHVGVRVAVCCTDCSSLTAADCGIGVESQQIQIIWTHKCHCMLYRAQVSVYMHTMIWLLHHMYVI